MEVIIKMNERMIFVMAKRDNKKERRFDEINKIKTPVFKTDLEREEFWKDYIASLFLVKIAKFPVDDIDQEKIDDFWGIWDYGYDFMNTFANSKDINEFKSKMMEYIDKNCSDEGGD